MPNVLRTVSLLLVPALLTAACTAHPPACTPSALWVAPATLQPIPDPLATALRHPVILLGEEHERAADHQWQLDTIGRLYAANPAMVLAFEMFPRAAQPALDRWTAGRLSEADFLAQSDWKHVWGFDPALYLPIFRFARDHHVPMVALNVSSRTIHLISAHGFAGVPRDQRENVGTPALPSPGYRAELTDVMGGHSGMAMTPDRLNHFIDAQLTWDRAMAEAIATQHENAPSRPVVAIMGAGHLEHRYGVPHQLDSLGLPGALVLLPTHQPTAPFDPVYADAVYVEPSSDGGVCPPFMPHV